MYLGDRLGWLDALAEGPATAAELAERTKTQPRYAIEWLEMMAVYGKIEAGTCTRIGPAGSMPFFRNQPSELQISDAVLAGRRSRLPARTLSNGARSRCR
ncbi:MAG TPA: hypothetical protein VFY56_03650 [Propionibacteriaceae bacterium]|nr:hypothetical protein [Propionibacteriaceae bacterium]